MDQTIKCVDCGADFIFEEGEQRWYEEKGMSAPKRCKPCRIKKRRERDSNRDQQY